MTHEQQQVLDAAENGELNQLDPKLLTQENLTIQDEYGISPLYIAACNGQLDQIPDELLTGENLMTKNKGNETCIRAAALYSNIHQIPKKLITEEDLLFKDELGWTALHFAAKDGHLDRLPRKLLTGENLTLLDDDGKTPLHWAVEDVTMPSPESWVKLLLSEEKIKDILKAPNLPEEARENLGKALQLSRKIKSQIAPLSAAIDKIRQQTSSKQTS